jgi:hypothetical protein
MSLFKASFFEKLIHLFKVHLHIEIHDIIHDLVTVNHIHYHTNQNAPLIQQIESHGISLNLGKIFSSLPPEEKDEFKKLIRETVLDDDIPLLEEKSKKRIEDIQLKESGSDIKPLLEFFRGKIPDDDFIALRAALYIKKRFDEGAPYGEIYSLKGELIEKYGSRGLKINNLVSSGYFETMIMPIYKQMANSPDFSQKDFLERYNLIINEEAFAVFVSGWMMADELAPIIHKKVRKNLKYGIHNITIHGIGKENVNNIKDILIDIEINYPVLRKSIVERNYIISAKFWFDKSKKI